MIASKWTTEFILFDKIPTHGADKFTLRIKSNGKSSWKNNGHHIALSSKQLGTTILKIKLTGEMIV